MTQNTWQKMQKKKPENFNPPAVKGENYRFVFRRIVVFVRLLLAGVEVQPFVVPFLHQPHGSAKSLLQFEEGGHHSQIGDPFVVVPEGRGYPFLRGVEPLHLPGSQAGS